MYLVIFLNCNVHYICNGNLDYPIKVKNIEMVFIFYKFFLNFFQNCIFIIVLM
jgi:hypothetical protein